MSLPFLPGITELLYVKYVVIMWLEARRSFGVDSSCERVCYTLDLLFPVHNPRGKGGGTGVHRGIIILSPFHKNILLMDNSTLDRLKVEFPHVNS